METRFNLNLDRYLNEHSINALNLNVFSFLSHASVVKNVFKVESLIVSRALDSSPQPLVVDSCHKLIRANNRPIEVSNHGIKIRSLLLLAVTSCEKRGYK